MAIQGQFTKAKAYCEKATYHYGLIGKTVAQCFAQINLALIYNLSNEHREALTVLKQLPEFVEEKQIQLTDRITGHINYHSAEAYLGMGDLNHAEESIMYAIAVEDDKLMPDCQRVMGEIKLLQGDLSAAENWIRQSIQFLHSFESLNLYLCAYSERVLARVLTKAGRWDEANMVKSAAIEHFQEIDLPHEVEKTQLLLGSIP